MQIFSTDMRILDALPMLVHHGREPSYVEDLFGLRNTGEHSAEL